MTSSSKMPGDRVVFTGDMLTNYLMDGHQELEIRVEMIVRIGDSMDNCVEVVAHGSVSLDTLVHGTEYDTDVPDSLTGETSIHMRAAEVPLIKSSTCDEHLDVDVLAPIIIGIYDDGHLDHLKLASLLSARTHQRFGTYSLRIRNSGGGSGGLSFDGDYEDTGTFRNEAPVYRNTSDSRYVMIRVPVEPQMSGIVSHTDAATWCVLDDQTKRIVLKSHSFEGMCCCCCFFFSSFFF